MTKSWNIDTLLPEAIRIYRAIEAQFGVKVYHPLPVRRYCQNAEDIKRCGRRSRNQRYANVLGDYAPAGAGPDAIADTHGSFEILQGGYVDLPLLIQTLHQHFKTQHKLRDEHVDTTKLTRAGTGWQYGETFASKVVFCEGAGLKANPWFRHLPLTPAKGETLILRSATLELPPSIYHSTKWLLPYGAQRFRIGATYDANDTGSAPTEAAKAELLGAANAILHENHSFEVEAHLAGIRPSTSDARPFLGEHPSEKGLFILNGLGSKGASVGPEMSRQLIAHLFDNTALDAEINITRYITRFNGSSPHTP